MVSSLAKAVRARHEIRGVISFDASAGPTPAVSRLPLSPSTRPLPLGVLHTRARQHVGETGNLLELIFGVSPRGRDKEGAATPAVTGLLYLGGCRSGNVADSAAGGEVLPCGGHIWAAVLCFVAAGKGLGFSFGWHSRPFSPATYFLSTSGLRDCASRLFPKVIRHFSHLICSYDSTGSRSNTSEFLDFLRFPH